MNKADMLFRQSMDDIKKYGTWDEDPRPKYSDGTPANSIYITQVCEKYDLNKGEFPITTLRPIPVKGGINEILAIYQTQTNTQEGFESHSISWWMPWMNNQGNIGRAYSYNLESHRPDEMKREIVKVDKKNIDVKMTEPVNSHFISVNVDNSLDGKIYSCSDGDYIIIEKFREEDNSGKKRTFKKIQFIETGYTTTCRYESNGTKDRYKRSVKGIGYLDDEEKIDKFPKKIVEKLFDIWCGMIKRCYSSNRKDYEYYKDSFVHQDWHSFANFVRDSFFIPQFHIAKEDDFNNYHLDKDYYGSNVYSRETCVFLHKNDNQLYRNCKLFYIKNKFEEKKFIRLQDAIDYINNGNTSNLHHALNTSRKYKGYDVGYVDDDYLYRYELSRNQINDLLYNLVHDKYSRRHMVNFFNWSNQNKKMLVECAYATHWSVRKVDDEYYLDMTLIQRSSDFLVANHINKIQYVALQMMVAKHCNYKVGSFVHLVQNLHIYSKHLEQMDELLSRTPSDKNPILKLNVPDGTNFYNISLSDFELINYEPVKPQLKFELGI